MNSHPSETERPTAEEGGTAILAFVAVSFVVAMVVCSAGWAAGRLGFYGWGACRLGGFPRALEPMTFDDVEAAAFAGEVCGAFFSPLLLVIREFWRGLKHPITAGTFSSLAGSFTLAMMACVAPWQSLTLRDHLGPAGIILAAVMASSAAYGFLATLISARIGALVEARILEMIYAAILFLILATAAVILQYGGLIDAMRKRRSWSAVPGVTLLLSLAAWCLGRDAGVPGGAGDPRLPVVQKQEIIAAANRAFRAVQ